MLKVSCFIESQQNRGNIPQYQGIIVSLRDGKEPNPTERERDSTIRSFPGIVMLSHLHFLESYQGIHENEEQQGSTTHSFLPICLRNGMKLEKRSVPWKSSRGLDKFTALGEKIRGWEQ